MTAQPTPLFPSSQHSPRILPSGTVRSAGLRVGDTDRTRVCDSLARHFAEGRLSPDELDARLAAATAAVIQTDLTALLSDLPATDGDRGLLVQHARPAVVRTAGATPVVDVLVWVGVIGAFGLIMLMMLGMGMASPLLFLGAAFGGMVAALFGGGIVHLIHRGVRRRHPPVG